jgi:hypothetical protein
MKMKRIAVAVLLTTLVVSEIPAMDLVEGEVLCSMSDIPSVIDSAYMAGRVEIPPDTAKEGHARVINTHSGDSYWSRYLMPSHVPSVEELRAGQLILWNESFVEPDPAEWAYRNQLWRFGLVTSTKEIFKGVIEVNNIRGYLQWCRLPDVPQQVDFRGGEVLCAYSREPAMENNVYSTATIETLPSEVSRGMAEVRYADGTRGWTRYVVPSRPARTEELAEGDWVLCSENHGSVRTELSYRYGNWYLMRITSLRDLFQGVVEANGINIPLNWVRVPVYSPEELEGIDMQEIVREARVEEALEWIRQQRMLTDWRIRKHIQRLHPQRTGRGETQIQMSAEDMQKDLEFYIGQVREALEIIAGLRQSVDHTTLPGADISQPSLDATGKFAYVRGTRRYREMTLSAMEELDGLVSLVAPPAMQSLEKAGYQTPGQVNGQSDTDASPGEVVMPDNGGLGGSQGKLEDPMEEKREEEQDISDNIEDQNDQANDLFKLLGKMMNDMNDARMGGARNMQ